MHTLFWHVLAREDSPVLICLDHTLSFVSILFYQILPFFNAFLSTVSICIYLYLFVSICIYLYLLSFTFCYPTPAQCMVSVYCFCVRNMNVGTIPPQPQPQTWVYRAPLGRFGEQWVINGLTVMIPPLALIWSYLHLLILISSSSPCTFWLKDYLLQRYMQPNTIKQSMQAQQSLPRCHCSHMGYGRAQQVLVASCASRWWCCR